MGDGIRRVRLLQVLLLDWVGGLGASALPPSRRRSVMAAPVPSAYLSTLFTWPWGFPRPRKCRSPTPWSASLQDQHRWRRRLRRQYVGSRRSGPPGCSSRGAPAAAPPSAAVTGRWRVGKRLTCAAPAESVSSARWLGSSAAPLAAKKCPPTGRAAEWRGGMAEDSTCSQRF